MKTKNEKKMVNKTRNVESRIEWEFHERNDPRAPSRQMGIVFIASGFT